MTKADKPGPERQIVNDVDYLRTSDSKANSQRVGNLNQEPAVRYHFAAMRCGDLSIWCAAMAGAAIIEKKKSLGHGHGYSDWEKSLPFSHGTVMNYTALAKALNDKIRALPKAELAGLFPEIEKAQDETKQSLALLGLPDPMDVFNKDHDRISQLIRHLTNERTLTQLYFDWEIVKRPKLLGGARTRGEELSPEEEINLRKERAREEWGHTLRELEIMGIKEESWAMLNKSEQEAILGVLEKVAKRIRQHHRG